MPILTTPQQRLHQLLSNPTKRLLIALAGLPGSGKTSLAKQLHVEFTNLYPAIDLQVLSMDGFHLSKAQLSQLANPEAALARRGAPWTFDALGFVDKVKQLKAGNSLVKWPSFEHSLGDPVPDVVQIEPNCQVLIVEGLYVLYREAAWAELAQVWDETWYLDTPSELAQERLIQRHQQVWDMSYQQALERVLNNDSKNAALVAETKQYANYLIKV